MMDSRKYNADTGADMGGASTDVGNATQPTTPDATTPTNTQTTPSAPTPTSEIEIDGFGKVKIDDIKEWKNGYMRQSDYTRKTQEIAKLRQEQKEANELYTYLKNNPQIAQAISNGDYSMIQNNPAFKSMNPYDSRIDDLNMKLAGFELDHMINNLKSKYTDFDEVEVLTEADRLGVSDLEFVYNALQGKKLPTLREQIQKEIEKNITERIRQNGIDTGSIITTNDAVAQTSHGLTDAEVMIAKKMGLSPEQYKKGKL